MVSVILPTYNEKENIVDLINGVFLYINRYVSEAAEVIVVDDDSPDGTAKLVKDCFSDSNKVRLIHRINEQCLASAIWRGIQEARGGVVAWMDADFSMPPYKLVELINKVRAGDYDAAVGSRFISGAADVRGPADSWFTVILSRLMNHFIALLLGNDFKDYTSGFAAVKKSVFDKIKIRGDYGEYFIDLVYRLKKGGYKIIELPYYCLPRRRGYSKTGANLKEYLQKGWKYILLALRLKFKGG
ncbi:MAG: glycosyltransferase [Candidatus Omnitrophota bacterium]